MDNRKVKHWRTKVLGLFLLLICMALIIVPHEAYAGDSGKLYLGGIDVIAHPTGTGYTYDAATQTLTLNNYSVSGKNYYKCVVAEAQSGVYLYSSLSDLKVVLKGTSTFTGDNYKYIKTEDINENNRVSAGIVAEGAVTITGDGALTIKTTVHPIYIRGDFNIKEATLHMTSYMDGSRGLANITIGTGSTVYTAVEGSNLAWHGLAVRKTLTVEAGAKLEAVTAGCSYDFSDPAAAYVEGSVYVYGELEATSNGKNKYETGCQGYALRIGEALDVYNGGSVIAKSLGQGKNGATAREAIYAESRVSVAGNAYLYAETNTTANDKRSAIKTAKLQIASDKNNTAIITKPSYGKHSTSDKQIHNQDGSMADTVNISGLMRLSLHLIKASDAEPHTWTYFDNSDSMAYSADGLNLSAEEDGRKPLDYMGIKSIIVESGEQTLILDNIVLDQIKNSYIRVKSGATLNIKLKGSNLLSGNIEEFQEPIIALEENATLNFLNGEGSDQYPSISILNQGGYAIKKPLYATSAGRGTITVEDSVLYVRGKDREVWGRADINSDLHIKSGGYVDSYLELGILTMDGGTFYGRNLQSITYKGAGGNLLLTGNTTQPTVTDSDGNTLYKVNVTLYDTASRFNTAERTAEIRTGRSSGIQKRFLMITSMQCADNYIPQTATGKIPVEVMPESNSDRNSTVTLYLPEGRQVMEATVGGVKYWSSANEEQKIIAKSDHSASGVLFITGHLLMKGTMAFREFTYVDMNTQTRTIGRQACPDYRGNGTYWIDYDENTGITLISPEGRPVTGYDLLIQSGSHELTINGLRLCPDTNSCAVIESNFALNESILTLKLIKNPANGTLNEMRSQNENGVFDLKGGLSIKSDTPGAKLTLGGTRAFGNTSKDTSHLNIQDSIVVNQCDDKESVVKLRSLTVSNSTVIGLGTIDCDDIRIDGGSVDFDVPEGTVVRNSTGQVLKKQVLRFDNIHSETKVTDITFTGMEGSSFDSSNIYTDENGTITLWVPESAEITELKLGEGSNRKSYYTVTFDFGIEGQTVIKPVESGMLATAPASVPDREGYALTGWERNHTEWNLDTDVVTESMTLDAVWELLTYTVTYAPGSNGTGARQTAVKTYGIPLVLQDALFERNGYTQSGWTQTDGGAKLYELAGEYTANEDIDLYPVWQENSNYVVKYDSAGGSDVGTKTSVKWTDKVLDGISDPTRDGYDFLGWECGSVPVNAETTYADLAGDDTVAEITVTACWKDIMLPTGSIAVGTDTWRSFHTSVDFRMYYNSVQPVTITAADNSGEEVTVEYLISDIPYTETELETAAFEPYIGTFNITAERKYIIYARLTDKANNVYYMNTTGLIIDTTMPVISGIENNKTYCEAQTVSITEKNLQSVYVDRTEVTLDENGQFVLAPAEGLRRIEVTDKAGNSVTMEVTVNDGHTLEWQSADGQYFKKCRFCDYETTRKPVPEFVLHSAERVCKTQDYVVTFELPENCSNPVAEYEFSGLGDTVSVKQENGIWKAVILSGAYVDGETQMQVKVSAETTDGYRFEIGRTVEILQQHIGGIATCTKKAVCDNCGEEYGAVDTHNHTALKHIAAQEATIRQEGNIEYWYCDDCGRYYKDAQTTQEIQQQETVIAKKNPGHTEESATTDQDGKATTDRSGKEVTQSPGTGDPADPALWLLLLMIAVGVGIGGGVSHKKRFLKK